VASFDIMFLPSFMKICLFKKVISGRWTHEHDGTVILSYLMK